MSTRTLNCYSCGAAVTSDAPNCAHCGARLASISCPSCFGMMFQGAKFCPHCGSPAVQWQSEATNWLCPSCRVPMLHGTLRDIPLHECGKCYGLWLGTAAFEQVCRNAEQQAAALGSARPISGPSAIGPVRYVRCPQCNDLMHRLNFARCSGVIVDVCRKHGTWFDANELHRIVQFIRAGGLDRCREREKAELSAERRRLETARMNAEPLPVHGMSGYVNGDLLSVVVEASGDLLVNWLGD